jgi:acetyl-CoA carboxylase carboxyltransferase component
MRPEFKTATAGGPSMVPNGRRVAIIANDFTVLASTNARINLKKMLQFKEQVKDQYQIPLIWLGEAGGARMPDCQGSKEVCSLGGGGVATCMPDYVASVIDC